VDVDFDSSSAGNADLLKIAEFKNDLRASSSDTMLRFSRAGEFDRSLLDDGSGMYNRGEERNTDMSNALFCKYSGPGQEPFELDISLI